MRVAVKVISSTPAGRSPAKLPCVSFFRVAGAAALIWALCSSPATSAQAGPKEIQEALIWTGFYAGPLDGNLGPGSIAAIRRFQTTTGDLPTGVLTNDEAAILLHRGEQQKSEAGFLIFIDETTGASMGFPAAYARNRRVVTNGSDFLSNDGDLVIGLRHYNCTSDILKVFTDLRTKLAATKIDYSAQRTDWFVISGTEQDRRYYIRFFSVPNGYDGIVASYNVSSGDRVSPALVMLSLTFRPSAKALSQQVGATAYVETIPLAEEIIPAPPVDTKQKQETQTVPPQATASAQQPGNPPIYLDSNDPSGASTLLLDSVQTLVSKAAGQNVKFFRYAVDKTHLSGFNSDMPVLRIVFPERVFFDTDKWNVRQEGGPVLDLVASSLRQQVGQVALFVAGHTDSRASEKYNLDLSIRRADSVARGLVAKGVGTAAIWRVGFGKAIPIRPNNSPQNMAFNRRVEFLVARQATIIAAWVDMTKSLCENGAGVCDEPDVSLSFRAAPIGRADLQPINVQVPARPSIAGQAKERPPLPVILLSRPSLRDFGNRE